jgi:hypothetical protein
MLPRRLGSDRRNCIGRTPARVAHWQAGQEALKRKPFQMFNRVAPFQSFQAYGGPDRSNRDAPDFDLVRVLFGLGEIISSL